MVNRYLLDTNIIIARFDESLPEKGKNFLDKIGSELSVITRIELLGWGSLTVETYIRMTDFVNDSIVYLLTESITRKAIDLRQTFKRLKTPDAIIAATAIEHGLALVTRNLDDFKQIPGLTIIKPFDLN
ncbi:MAG TPA: type II toxin-antitoxin system VapC family toxin [Dinghuibacter sp.]|uniref:type II toxin-antitoxin system VapC family toxin n=1 Tax=Dinghuibacter sp. TaxID=2024697 RepID=UPI002B99C179|nr:type II toxin-antitoxin system VapC family toxin [Dinghuibacter sp.]HTJ10828.1 type II toxin-antitoxin system VapC family toxin [Dinghuibacter sp.]